MVTQNEWRMREGKQVVFSKLDFKFATAVDLKKGLEQTKSSISLYMCAPMSDSPFKLFTMSSSFHPRNGRKSILHLLLLKLLQSPNITRIWRNKYKVIYFFVSKPCSYIHQKRC